MYLWNYVAVYKVDRIDRMKPSGLFRWFVIPSIGVGIDIDIAFDIDIEIDIDIPHCLSRPASKRFGCFRVQPMSE